MREIEQRTLTTPRLTTQVRIVGDPTADDEAVVFLHGNLSDSQAWHEQLGRLPEGFVGVAPDLRGYGHTEPAPVDATRGVGDWVDDLRALVEELGLGAVHLVGHSLGAGPVYGYALAHPDAVRSITLVAPVSPYGYGGTFADGRPCHPDHAGSGAGAVNPELIERVRDGDRGEDSPFSPRNVVRTLYFPSPDVVREEDVLVEGILATRVGDDHWPGDAATSEHWPGVAPGTRGVLNAISPRHFDVSAFADAPRATTPLAVPVLWVRGALDAIVSDTAMTDLGYLGSIEAVPGWPGADVYPPQPMVGQTRDVLERYAAAGGSYREVVYDDAGHFPYVQHPDAFAEALAEHLRA